VVVGETQGGVGIGGPEELAGGVVAVGERPERVAEAVEPALVGAAAQAVVAEGGAATQPIGDAGELARDVVGQGRGQSAGVDDRRDAIQG